ncbi:MAG: hypothetical protein AAF559_04135 [Pseudomonadota bacterium]
MADTEVEIVDPNDELGLETAIVHALARSRGGVPTPARDANHITSLLKAANVSSWSTFVKLAKCVEVFAKEGVLEITPYQNLGGSDGFEPMTESVTHLTEDVTGLGASVLKALVVAK